ncbi:MAG: DUF3489 domain-containing protein, partial [Acidobacteria bacterium]|nr:DUF3489 domain-containing protein [Acidobacteriota bacterium]
MAKNQKNEVGKKKRKPGSVRNGRAGSKKNEMIQLLKRPDGVTLQELMAATGWQGHSVRGFISAGVNKRMGLRVTSNRREDGQRVYRVTDRL